MRRIILLLLTVSLLFITSCELFTEEPTKGDVYYINVGLDYENNGISTDNLSGTVNDAKELYEALGEVINKTGRNKTGTLMVQEAKLVDPSNPQYPSKTHIENKLTGLQSIKDNDLTIFTYSGHGYSTTGELVFATTTVDSGPFLSDLMNAEELLSLMALIPGKKRVILDSCFSGMFVEASPSSTNTILNNSIAKFFETYHSSDIYGKPDLFVLTASAHADSYEAEFDSDVDHSHGFFSYALLKALGWGHPHDVSLSLVKPIYPPAATFGQITVDGLFKYIIDNQGIPSSINLFTNWTEYQHPMTTGGPLDLVLFNL